MGWDVLKVINRGNASGAAFQTGMCGDIFDQFTAYPDAAPIPEAFEKFFSSTYRHFPKLSPTLYQKMNATRLPSKAFRSLRTILLSERMSICRTIWHARRQA